MDKRHPRSIWTRALLDRERCKAQPRVQQQTGRVGIEAGYPHLHRVVLSPGERDHGSHKVPSHTLPPGMRRHHKIPDTTYAYISPSWYETKAETGRVVPTWNYLAVHAEGSARIIEDPIWLKHHLSRLTDQHESGMSVPWSVDDAPSDFTERLVQAIVGVEIKIDSLTGKLKASQNQPERNRAGVKAGLEAREGADSRGMSKFIS